MRTIIPTVTAILILVAVMMPAYAALSYLDVEGTYNVSSRAVPRYMDNARHPTVQFDRLIITTQTGKVISDATLEHMGADIAVTGLVGPGSRPTIVLSGTDSDGTVVAIQGRVITDRDGIVTAINGRIMGYVTSDGERDDDSGDGTSAISAVAYHSEPLSTLLTAGSDNASVYLQFNSPVNRLKLRNLTNLRSGQLGFWFNLQDTKTPGPQMVTRFIADPTSYNGTAGYVDITIDPYSSLTGNSTWQQASILTTTVDTIYSGKDPTDGTSFSYSTANTTLAEIEALINIEAAMVADGDSASNWVLYTVRIETYEAGARTCYIDDVTIGGVLYTLEPNNYFSNFRAVKQE